MAASDTDRVTPDEAGDMPTASSKAFDEPPREPPLPVPSAQGGRETSRRWRRLIAGAAVAAAVLLAAAAGAGFVVVRGIEVSLPPPPDPAKVETSTVVLDHAGKLLRPFAIADGRWRLPVTKDDVDPRFLKMLIGYEDRRFGEHHGVDYRALLRAAGQFLLAGGHIVSGGSTLTMQVARLLGGEPTRDAASKLRQMLEARDLEAHLSKDQILDLYLTLAPYGGNIEGVRAASLAYFGKEPTRLTIAEAALLVALPQSPEARRPDRDGAAAHTARDRVLDRLAAAGVIDADAADAAKSERMPAARKPFPMLAPHLAYEALAARARAGAGVAGADENSTSPLAGEVGAKRREGGRGTAEVAIAPGTAVPLPPSPSLPHTGGGSADALPGGEPTDVVQGTAPEPIVAAAPPGQVIKLTVDRDLQASLESLAADRVAALGPKLSVAIVVADEVTGAIEASVGSAGIFDDARAGHVDMTRALRSPGSTLKPLIYGLAFEQGLAHPESLIDDRPTGFGAYAPQNFDGFHRGTVTMREALNQSLNVPAIIVLDAVGPARLVARMKRAGILPVLPDQSAPGLAVGLGGLGITLRDLVQLYAAIARGGTAVTLRDGVDDKPIIPLADAGAAVLTPTAAWYVSDILSTTPPPVNGSPGRVAFKTGTSYGYRDAWAIGFDGRNVIGVWIGRPDGTPVPGLSGIVSAAPILFEAFDRVGEKRTPLRPRPADALVASTAQLPLPLRHFRRPDEAILAHDDEPQIAYPQDGVEVDLGIKEGDPAPLVIKIRNGEPPFTFFANGLPIGRTPFDRSETWQPDGPGFVTLSVVDSSGRSDRVTVFVE